MQLRPYQHRAVAETLAHLRSGKSTLLVSPTGSGKTAMAAKIATHFKRIILLAHRRELLNQAREACGLNVCIHSVQSLSRPECQHRDFVPDRPDLLIIDEAHRAAADSYQKIIERYPEAPRLGLTATPLRTDGRGLSDAFAEMVEAAKISELVKGKYLVPYRAFEAPDAALRELAWMKRVAGDYATRELTALMNQPRLVGDIVREYLKHAAGRSAVCFAVSVEHSLALTKALQSAGVRAAHVDGRSSERLRQEALDKVAVGSLDVLCNVNLFTEGWDCPAVSCVIMARPTASLTLYLQCVGRGMRRALGKSDLLILDHAGNMQRHGYPDVDRDWRLESERELADREAQEAEAARLRALGFDSVEAELEEKRRIRDGLYSGPEVLSVLGSLVQKQTRGTQGLGVWLGKFGVTPHLAGHAESCLSSWFSYYLRSDIDRLRHLLEDTYSIEECRSRLSIKTGQSVAGWLKVRGIEPVLSATHCTQRFDKAAIEELAVERARVLSDSYSKSEAIKILGINGIDELARRDGLQKPRHGRYGKAQVDARARLSSESYTKSEAAKVLGVRHQDVYGLAKQAHIPRLLRGRYGKAQVDALASARRAAGASIL